MVIIIVALTITVLFLIVATVIDLGATRSDRRGGQSAVDSAAASAGQTLAETGDAQQACEDALEFAAVALETSPFTGANCASLLSCAASVPKSVTGTSGQYTITVHHPVLASSALMVNSSSISNAGVAASADDGAPCDRMAVELSTTGDPFFGGIAGSTERTSTVHAVTRVSAGSVEERPLNLLTLERFRCDAFVVSGQGNVIVASAPSSSGGRSPGVAAVDSDGTTSCNGNASTLNTSGQGDLIANGPCPSAPNTECVGEGLIGVFAPISSGTCAGTTDVPGCREGANGEITPTVVRSPDRFTRAPIDHRFNCKPSYSGEPWASPPLDQDIAGCSTATSDTDYVDELKAYVASITSMNAVTRLLPANGTWRTIGGNNPACSVSNITYVGNVFVDCATFIAGANVTFAGGNVIFRDQVRVQGGNLRLHAPCPTPAPIVAPLCASSVAWSAGTNYAERQSSTLAGWVSVGGELRVSSGSVRGEFATLFFPEGDGLLTSTGGNFTWEAPDGVGPFDDLALWSEGTGEHSLGGNGGIDVVGTLFTGQATFNYAGGTAQDMDEAQFVANRLRFTGLGALRMSPHPDRNVSFPLDPLFNLIR